MQTITVESSEAKSKDIVAGNVAAIKELFPDAFAEGKIDFDVLKQLLGEAVEEREEKYGLNWHGKRKALQLALTPSTGTLRPAIGEGVDEETTQNILIEGDNLEVLKLLQKCYSGKIKLIYIDPPYNTGGDFVYPDNFTDSIRNYLEITGQIEGGAKITSNLEASGRFHTDWLTMMYPRLQLARNLLCSDGLCCISIDDNELHNLICLCESVFGQENYVGTITRNTGTSTGGGGSILVNIVDHIVVFSKTPDSQILGVTHTDSEASIYDQEDEHGKFLSRSLRRTGGENRREDRPNMYYPIAGPDGIEVFPIGPGGYESRWVCGSKRFEELERLGLIQWKQIDENGKLVWKPFQKFYLEGRKKQPSNLWLELEGNKKATRDLSELLSDQLFDAPKPIGLITQIISIACDTDDLILDFFAGSGTTGHAIMVQNALDGGNRRYILVQLPEPLDPANRDQKAAANFCDGLFKPRNIAELTKERLRRAGKKVKADNPIYVGDVGFRVFKLDSSNIRAWDPKPADLDASLFAATEHLKNDRTEADILTELLLKLGLDLTVPIESKTIGKKVVYTIGAGVLFVCLETSITRKDAEPLAIGLIDWHKELAPVGESTVVFRDSAFEDDVAKTNIAAILTQNGLSNVRSL